MNLPNAHIAIVDARKVSDYLLNAAHPDNGGKAKFFEALGYVRPDTSPLVTALKSVAAAGNVVDQLESAHGQKYVVDGLLMSHTDQSRFRPVRTIWIIEGPMGAPRLVTAYPGEE